MDSVLKELLALVQFKERLLLKNPSGATVEKMVATTFLENTAVLNLHQADFSQADKIAETINDTFGPEVATP